MFEFFQISHRVSCRKRTTLCTAILSVRLFTFMSNIYLISTMIIFCMAFIDRYSKDHSCTVLVLIPQVCYSLLQPAHPLFTQHQLQYLIADKPGRAS